jgi:hypothetical protein
MSRSIVFRHDGSHAAIAAAITVALAACGGGSADTPPESAQPTPALVPADAPGTRAEVPGAAGPEPAYTSEPLTESSILRVVQGARVLKALAQTESHTLVEQPNASSSALVFSAPTTTADGTTYRWFTNVKTAANLESALDIVYLHSIDGDGTAIIKEVVARLPSGQIVVASGNSYKISRQSTYFTEQIIGYWQATGFITALAIIPSDGQYAICSLTIVERVLSRSACNIFDQSDRWQSSFLLEHGNNSERTFISSSADGTF